MKQKTMVALLVAAALIGLAFLWNTLGAEARPAEDPLPLTPVVNEGASARVMGADGLILPSWFYPRLAHGTGSRDLDHRQVIPSASFRAARGPEPPNTPAPPFAREHALTESQFADRPAAEPGETSTSASPARELRPVINTGREGPLPQHELLRQTGFRVDISSQRTPATSRISSQSASDERCVNVLQNPQLDVVEFGDGTGSIDYWSVLFQKVYYDTEPGFYLSPSSSLLLVDELDGSDPDLVDLEGVTWDYDAFAQGFTVPPGLTGLRVYYSSKHAEIDTADYVRSYLWTLTQDGYLDDWLAYADIDKGADWASWYWDLPDTMFPYAVGKPVAVLYEMRSDRLPPGEWMWLDDLQVTICYQRGPSASYLPVTFRQPPKPTGPTCSPYEDDSPTNPGSMTVGATCGGHFSPIDEKDYYRLTLNGASKVRVVLSNLPPGSNWQAGVYEIAPRYPYVCHIGDPGHGPKSVDCKIEPNKDYLVSVARGTQVKTGPYTLRVERR